MVKILLNPTYVVDSSKPTPLKTKLSKQLSRTVFAITEIDEEDEDEDQDEKEDEDQEDEEGKIFVFIGVHL